MRRLGMIIGLLSLLSGGFAKQAYAADQLCFAGIPGIVDCISGRFLSYWQQNGGLAVFGYPLTPARQEQTAEGSFLTQYFERQRFELHPEYAAPYDVLLGRLGAEIFERTQGDWRALPTTNPQAACLFFEATRHNVCAPFAAYWQNHGLLDPNMSAQARSLALLGLPLTEPRMERNPDGDVVLTQWFERARLEDHGGKGVLLGRLGAEIRSLPGLPPVAGLAPDLQKAVDLLNAERSARGLGTLNVNSQLNSAAQAHSDDMARNNMFSHTGSDGSDAGQRIGRTGYGANRWGENIAAGYTNPADLIKAWMGSDGHRRNILDPNFRELGIGLATNPGSTYGNYWTMVYAAR